MLVERNMIIKEYFNSMEYVYCLFIFEYQFIYRKSTFNPTPVRGGVYITPPTKKSQLLLKIVILKSPNFVTFPIYTGCPKKNVH